MRETDVIDAINELEGTGNIVMDRIASYIKANLDDFMGAFECHCPECNELGWDDVNGQYQCENGHIWYAEK